MVENNAPVPSLARIRRPQAWYIPLWSACARFTLHPHVFGGAHWYPGAGRTTRGLACILSPFVMHTCTWTVSLCETTQPHYTEAASHHRSIYTLKSRRPAISNDAYKIHLFTPLPGSYRMLQATVGATDPAHLAMATPSEFTRARSEQVPPCVSKVLRRAGIAPSSTRRACARARTTHWLNARSVSNVS